MCHHKQRLKSGVHHFLPIKKWVCWWWYRTRTLNLLYIMDPSTGYEMHSIYTTWYRTPYLAEFNHTLNNITREWSGQCCKVRVSWENSISTSKGTCIPGNRKYWILNEQSILYSQTVTDIVKLMKRIVSNVFSKA